MRTHSRPLTCQRLHLLGGLEDGRRLADITLEAANRMKVKWNQRHKRRGVTCR